MFVFDILINSTLPFGDEMMPIGTSLPALAVLQFTLQAH